MKFKPQAVQMSPTAFRFGQGLALAMDSPKTDLSRYRQGESWASGSGGGDRLFEFILEHPDGRRLGHNVRAASKEAALEIVKKELPSGFRIIQK